MNNELRNLYGIDVDKETSLLEYGLLIMPYTNDGYSDEYFVVYSVGDNAFDTGYKRECEINGLINGTDWASNEDVNGLLSYVGMSKEEWLTQAMVHKLSDCINYWGYENIMGACYHSIDTNKAKESYL